MKPLGPAGWRVSDFNEATPRLPDAAKVHRELVCGVPSPPLIEGHPSLTQSCCRPLGHGGRHRADGIDGAVQAVWL